MKKPLFFLFCTVAFLMVTARTTPLLAQYNPPPPPEQQDTGESPDQGQPMDDQSVPPPDQGAPPDQQDAGPQDQANAPADPSGDANFQTFYDNLNSEGNWIQTNDYGYVFQPNVQDPDWRPYSDGHWVYTDEGWTWVADSSEPWGWATYHYGRWANLDNYGWVWVPGYTWAPAWVSWRYGDGYCGWAPLPPSTLVGVDFGGNGLGFQITGDCDTAFDIGPGYYNFIRVGDFGGRDYRHHYIDRNNNFGIINNTRNVTNIFVNSHRQSGRFSRVSVGGPSFATINAQSGTPVQRVRLSRSNRVGAASMQGNQLAVFAPHVAAAPNSQQFRPRRVAATVPNATINAGTDISRPLAVTQHVRGAAANSQQIAAAQNVHFSSTAHVATPQTHASAGLPQPLHNYQPHVDARATGQGAQAHLNNAAVHNNASINANPAVGGVRPESAYTGGAANSQVQHHQSANGYNASAGVNATPGVNPNTQAQHHLHQQSAQGGGYTEHSANPQVQQSVVHHQEAPVQHFEPAPVHESAPVQHEAVQHHEAVQQHSAAPPAPPHPAPQAAHAAPANNGGGGGHDKDKH